MHKYIVKSANQITDTTLLLNLEPKSGRAPLMYQPGQYAAISFYRHGRPTPARCFSIVSSPTDQSKLQFSMRTKGHFTKTAAQLKPGSVVKVRGPYGGFVLDIANYDDLVFLAGGIGITPFMSMVSYTSSIKAPTKITLFYSCQTQDDVPFLEELRNLEKQNPNLRVIYVIGNGATDKLAGLLVATGHLTPEIMDANLINNYSNRSFYICGPPPYMNAMAKTLKQKGVNGENIITEAFAQGSHDQTGKVQSWPYNIYVLGGASLVLGSLAITISDMLKTLPPQSLLSSANLTPTLKSSNSRQRDLDALVNGLPSLSTSGPSTAAVQASDQAAQNDQTAALTTPTASTSTPTAVTSAPVVQAPVVTSPPPKTCTTTQSGVTTCV